MTQFLPRQSFSIPCSIPKTYFLGHHHAGTNKIKSVLPGISLVLECRDFRLPLSTHNPKLEQTLAGCQKLVVYTKFDLGSDSSGARQILRKLHGDRVVFWDKNNPGSTAALLGRLKDVASELDSLTGLRTLVVGMPNVGKSTLLNALRNAGTAGKKAKVAKTGDQAGVTRKVGTTVRIVQSGDRGGTGAGVFMLDSPGIFQPYVEDGETMIKVALVHGIKKGLIPDEILADYLLYRMNLWDPILYSRYCPPTNDINEFLVAVSKRDGKLRAGGVPNLQESAARILAQWRNGRLGKYILDDVSQESIQAHAAMLAEPAISLTQAKKTQKEARRKDGFGT